MVSEWKTKVERSFGGCAHSYADYDDVQERVARRLASFLPDVAPGSVLEIGCGTGNLTRHLVSAYPQAHFHITDLSAAMVAHVRARMQRFSGALSCDVLDADAEIEGAYNLIISSMAAQWFEDMDQAFARQSRALAAGGEILYAMPGPDTFKQWRGALQDLNLPVGLLEFQTRDDVFEEEHFEVRYDSGFEFLRQMKHIGAHTPRAPYAALSPRDLRRACQKLDDDFNACVTWHIVYGRIKAS